MLLFMGTYVLLWSLKWLPGCRCGTQGGVGDCCHVVGEVGVGMVTSMAWWLLGCN